MHIFNLISSYPFSSFLDYSQQPCSYFNLLVLQHLYFLRYGVVTSICDQTCPSYTSDFSLNVLFLRNALSGQCRMPQLLSIPFPSLSNLYVYLGSCVCLVIYRFSYLEKIKHCHIPLELALVQCLVHNNCLVINWMIVYITIHTYFRYIWLQIQWSFKSEFESTSCIDPRRLWTTHSDLLIQKWKSLPWWARDYHCLACTVKMRK